MTPSPQLSPERLARLLDQAVGQVTPAPGTLDRIHRGVRRRRWLRRAGATMLSAAVLAGGGVTVLTVAPGVGPGGSAAASPSGSAAAASASSAPTSVTAGNAAAVGGITSAAAGPSWSMPTVRQAGRALEAPDGDEPAVTSAKIIANLRRRAGPVGY
jgi:hypothetical protein